MKKKRTYLQYCEKSLNAIRLAISSFNSIHEGHKNETTLMLLTNAWELLGKAILIKKHEDINKDKHGRTISAEETIQKLVQMKVIDDNQNEHIQQIISLRNEAIHGLLPEIPVEIVHHLFYFACKFYKDIIVKVFPIYRSRIEGNYLSISFANLTTYADKVQKLVSRFRKGNEKERKIIWLLERGVSYSGGEYISQTKFEKDFKRKAKWKLLPHLKLGQFLKTAEMIRIVPIQAPKNYTADVKLRKGKQSDTSLPVVIKKTDIETDYPYLTGELSGKLGKSVSFVSKTIKMLGLRNNEQYHQAVRSSKNSVVQRYSESTLSHVKEYLIKNPGYSPFKSVKVNEQK